MSKATWIGSIAAALLVTGCAVATPSIFQTMILLDNPEEGSDACAADCTHGSAQTTDKASNESVPPPTSAP
jgi:hypothetical protein